MTNPGAPMTEDCGPLYAVVNFTGMKESENNYVPPDTMGAVGPRHFMSVLNGGVAVYDKYSGQRRTPTTPVTAFNVTIPSGQYAGTHYADVDPRVVYDHVDQRWILSALDTARRHVILAISDSSDPIGTGGATWVADNWRIYLVPFGVDGAYTTDFPTLGVDANGIYIVVRRSRSELCPDAIAALPKAPFLLHPPTAQPVQDSIFTFDNRGCGEVHAAMNLDPVGSADPAWLVAFTGLPPALKCRKIVWQNGVPQFYPWEVLADTGTFAYPGPAPQFGSSQPLIISHLGAGVVMAMTRKVGGIQYIWTCRTIQVNSAGNNDNGLADRTAIEWFKIQAAPILSIVASGRIFDTAATNPKFYFLPSVAANKNGDMVLGFSGSSATTYLSAYYWGKLASGLTPASPTCYFSGKDFFGTSSSGAKLGDYSHTSLDPDGMTFWTIQEYADTRYLADPSIPVAWGTRIVAVTPF